MDPAEYIHPRFDGAQTIGVIRRRLSEFRKFPHRYFELFERLADHELRVKLAGRLLDEMLVPDGPAGSERDAVAVAMTVNAKPLAWSATIRASRLIRSCSVARGTLRILAGDPDSGDGAA